MKQNVEINNWQELVTVHELALGSTEREVAFTVEPVGVQSRNALFIKNVSWRLVTCYISNLTKRRAHCREWDITVPLAEVFEEHPQSWAKRAA